MISLKFLVSSFISARVLIFLFIYLVNNLTYNKNKDYNKKLAVVITLKN